MVNILGSILSQLLLQIPNPLQVPNEVTRKLEDNQQQCKHVETADILSSLRLLLPQFKCVFICLDALDELILKEGTDLMNLMYSKFNPTVNRVFLTGQHHIKPEVDRRFQQGTTEIEITADASDIKAYLHHKIVEDSHINSGSMNGRLEEEIVSTITKRSKGM